MTYLKVIWNHTFDDDPVEMLSELDQHRNEIRKIELFRGGVIRSAGPNGGSGTTQLSETPVPSVEDIASDLQFQVQMLTSDAFEHLWQAANIATAA